MHPFTIVPTVSTSLWLDISSPCLYPSGGHACLSNLKVKHTEDPRGDQVSQLPLLDNYTNTDDIRLRSQSQTTTSPALCQFHDCRSIIFSIRSSVSMTAKSIYHLILLQSLALVQAIAIHSNQSTSEESSPISPYFHIF